VSAAMIFYIEFFNFPARNRPHALSTCRVRVYSRVVRKEDKVSRTCSPQTGHLHGRQASRTTH
jgi:hypothetical protein